LLPVHQVLRFYGYFKETVPESRMENHRVRKIILYYYLEDDSMHMAEPKTDNSGIPQVRAHTAPCHGMACTCMPQPRQARHHRHHVHACVRACVRARPCSPLPARAISPHPLHPPRSPTHTQKGVLIKRHKVTKEDGTFFTPVDFSVGAELSIYGRAYFLTDVDKFTREFYDAQVRHLSEAPTKHLAVAP
jgi:transposase